MVDEHRDSSERSPFGERNNKERQQPFGKRTFGERRRPAPTDEWRIEDYTDETNDEELTFDPDAPPLVRVSLDDIPEAPLPDELMDEDMVQAEATRRRVMLRDESPDAPALIRVRDRRGTVSPRDSFLKTPDSDGTTAADAARGYSGLDIRVLVLSIAGIFFTAAVVATLFTWWTPNTFLPAESVAQLSVALATQSGIDNSSTWQPSLTPNTELSEDDLTPVMTALPVVAPTLTSDGGTLNNIGVVSGHRGIHPDTGLPDPGAVCDDGLTETEINETVANYVVQWLTDHGYQVDLFDEFDPGLEGYEALVMISIHSDSCAYINEYATGFKIASFTYTVAPEEDDRLVQCLIDRYSATTGMSFHPGVTDDMTEYHTFREISPGTPGAIVEIGFMNLDRELLTQHPDVVALGVARGLLCYLRNEPINAEDPTLSAPTETPES